MSTRVTYLLGIVDADRSVAPPLLLARAGRVGAVYTDLPAEELPGSTVDPLDESGPLARLARRHDETLRGLAADGPVLPIRLGCVAASPAAVERALAAHADELAAELERVRGRAEWTVRTVAAPRAAQPPDESSGTSYLLSRRAQTQERATASALLDDTYRALAAYAEGVSSASYLVSGGREAEFLAAALQQDAALHAHGYGLRVTGPLPPYSFVDLRLTFGDDD